MNNKMNNKMNNNLNFYLNKKINLTSIFKFIDSFDNNIYKKRINFRFCSKYSCISKARYGVLKNCAIYCHKHKDEYMFDVMSKKCNYKSCNVQPTFGYYCNKPEYCKKHSLDGMVNVKVKLCIYKDCTVKARYMYKSGVELNLTNELELFLYFNSIPLYCSKHKTDKMIPKYT